MHLPAKTISAMGARPSDDAESEDTAPKQSVSGRAVPSALRNYAAKGNNNISSKTPPPPPSVTVTSATASSVPHSTSVSMSKPARIPSTSDQEHGDVGLFGVSYSSFLFVIVDIVCEFLCGIQAS